MKRLGHTNALKRLKETLRQDMVEDASQSWVKHLTRAVKALNSNSHDHLMGSAPSDVKGNNVLQYALKKEAGQDAMKNTKQHADRTAALRAAGAFRVLLPSKTFTRTTTARWSNEVHQVSSFIGIEVVDTKGARFHVRDTQPVKATSKDTKAPADLGSAAKGEMQRTSLRNFARALNGFLGAEGLTLQGAGTKLRKVPGFTEAMTEAKVTGIGALERFIRLFPDMFVVEGEAQRKRVRRT